MATGSNNALSIAPATFLSILHRCKALTASPSAISKPKASSSSSTAGPNETLQVLDLWRVETLPKIVNGGAVEGGKPRDPPYLTLTELEDVLTCKMKRGKFRPTLLPLLRSNSPSTIEEVTRASFAHLKDTNPNELPSTKAVTDALNHLSKNLKGVGPATASYVLAARAPNFIPAFSDEAFRWVFSETTAPGVKGGQGEGWKRKMDYSLKEYLAYFHRVQEISQRLIEEAQVSYKNNPDQDSRDCGDYRQDFGASSVEMVGWVLGKEASGWAPGTTLTDSIDTDAEADTKVGGLGERKRKQDEDHRNPGESKKRADKSATSSMDKRPKLKKPQAPTLAEVNDKHIPDIAADGGGLRRSARNR
ncbi:hypothetical protein DFH27DRAFT_166375 [Peziza echinospora]|nr:hypothetical protein DFH27DRAFT_166375 [Peziza echinospora]